MLFEQKIKYLDYYEAEERIRGAGFIRMECWGETCKIVIQVAGVFEEASGAHPIMITFGESQVELGEIRLERGKGRAEIRELWCADVSGGRGEVRIPVTEAEKVLIPLGNDRELRAILRVRPQIEGNGDEALGQGAEGRERDETGTEAKGQAAAGKNGKEENKKSEDAKGGNVKGEDAKGENEKREDAKGGNVKGEGAKGGNVKGEDAKGGNEKREDTKGEEAEVSAAERHGSDAVSNGGQPVFTAEASLKPGKWDQLGAIYPRISPFGDTRRYLQISPGDFVILKDRSYRMVNNSFLLHGYFTYRHLILHRMRRNGEMIYYVGVPGVYFEKEKEVAVLFGFESFEGAEEPAREGDFGYYMMRVEL